MSKSVVSQAGIALLTSLGRSIPIAECLEHVQKGLRALLDAYARMRPDPTCAVCGQPTAERYTVEEALWHQAGLQRSDHAHLVCLQMKLPTPLRYSDFPDLPINATLRAALNHADGKWLDFLGKYTESLIAAVVEETVKELIGSISERIEKGLYAAQEEAKQEQGETP